MKQQFVGGCCGYGKFDKLLTGVVLAVAAIACSAETDDARRNGSETPRAPVPADGNASAGAPSDVLTPSTGGGSNGGKENSATNDTGGAGQNGSGGTSPSGSAGSGGSAVSGGPNIIPSEIDA